MVNPLPGTAHAAAIHHTIAADRHRVPAPFRSFAVRSDEAQHAWDARAPYGRVHLVRTSFLDDEAITLLRGAGYARVTLQAFSDVEYASTSYAELSTTAAGARHLDKHIASALQLTEVLGHDPAAYRHSIASRVDYLACRGAGFHNDIGRHWSRCLFWILAIDAAEVTFVMPHAEVCVSVAPGDLLVFDPCLAHGLCRTGDGLEARAESFEQGHHQDQLFLTGELLLNNEQWASLGSPWQPVEAHEAAGALDLMVAEFDERSGAIKGLRALREGMKRSTCHVDSSGL